jgi:hypothetical protein
MSSLKLYEWKCELYKSPKWRLSLRALASNEREAKMLILGKIQTAEIREQVEIYFSDAMHQPAVYEAEVAFVESQGIPTLV